LVSEELELQLKIHRLELEHHDLIEQRNAILFAEWSVPLALLTTLITIIVSKGYAVDFWSFLGILAVIIVPYRVVHDERIIRDNLLEGVRNQIDELIKDARKAPPENTS